MILIKGNKIKVKTPVTHFYNIQSDFQTIPDLIKSISLQCKICKNSVFAPFQETSNLSHHLNTHDESKKRNKLYKWSTTKNKQKNNTLIDDKLLNFINLFITSNMSGAILNNEYMSEILK